MTEQDLKITPRTDHSDLEALKGKRDFKGILKVLAVIESQGDLSADQLVLKGRSIQLARGDAGVSLKDAEEAFASAVRKEPSHVPALLELAWYYYAVEDAPSRALPLFEKATEIARDRMVEAVDGRAKCLEELESEAAARSFVVDFREEVVEALHLGKNGGVRKGA